MCLQFVWLTAEYMELNLHKLHINSVICHKINNIPDITDRSKIID